MARLDEPTLAVLFETAERLRLVHPGDVLNREDLTVRLVAEACKQVDAGMAGNALGLARAARTVLPELREGITRGEYVLLVRDVVVKAGHDWPDGDDDPAIPRITGIPGPRTEPDPMKIPAKVPQQPGPDSSAAPTCCGRAMRRDGSQWVCGKCQGWTDSGRTALTLVPELDQEVTV